jgi:hypothetical protein
MESKELTNVAREILANISVEWFNLIFKLRMRSFYKTSFVIQLFHQYGGALWKLANIGKRFK